MSRQKIVISFTLLFSLLFLGISLANQPALAGAPAQKTTEEVQWGWDDDHAVGSSQLIRNHSGLTAVFDTSELPAGQAVTLWFIIFNNPEHCSTSPCSLPADLFTEGVEGDFHFASGHVTGGSGNTSFAGRLNVGDTSGSGRVELGIDDGVGLIDPYKAEVLLAVHSHGPALTGKELKDQLSSFSGGCEVFLGPNGFASGPDEVPDEAGECSTIQFSLHKGNHS